MRGSLLLSLLVALGTVSALTAAPPTPNSCDKYVGVWEYVDPSPPGRAIISKYGDKYTLVWVATARDRKLPAGAPSTDADKAQAYSTAFAGAAEMTCGPVRDRFRIVHHLNPAEVGTEFQTEAEASPDALKWWYIKPDGTRGDMGAARRLK
jgi:hypothetical protein